MRFHPGHVRRIMRQVRWSYQGPVGRARERDEQAIMYWKRVRWPQRKEDSSGLSGTVEGDKFGGP